MLFAAVLLLCLSFHPLIEYIPWFHPLIQVVLMEDYLEFQPPSPLQEPTSAKDVRPTVGVRLDGWGGARWLRFLSCALRADLIYFSTDS